MISKNQSNLLSCELLGQPDLHISDQDIFMASKSWPKKRSLTSESPGTGFCRVPSPSPQAGEFLNWNIYWWAGYDCQGKDLQLPLKMPSQPARINLCSAPVEMDVLFPQAPSALGSFVPGTRAGPKLHTRCVLRLLLAFLDANTSYISLLCRHTEVISIFNAQQ